MIQFVSLKCNYSRIHPFIPSCIYTYISSGSNRLSSPSQLSRGECRVTPRSSEKFMEFHEPTEVFTLTFTPTENYEPCTSLDCGGTRLSLLFSCKLHQSLVTPAVLKRCTTKLRPLNTGRVCSGPADPEPIRTGMDRPVLLATVKYRDNNRSPVTMGTHQHSNADIYSTSVSIFSFLIEGKT